MARFDPKDVGAKVSTARWSGTVGPSGKVIGKVTKEGSPQQSKAWAAARGGGGKSVPGSDKFELPHRQEGGYSNRLSHDQLVENAKAATAHATAMSERAKSEGTRGAHNAAANAHSQAFGAHERVLEHGNQSDQAAMAAATAGRKVAATASIAHRDTAKSLPKAAASGGAGGGGDQPRDDHGRFAGK